MFYEKDSTVSQSPPSPPPRRRFSKWCRRSLYFFLLLLVLAVIFHRPLLLALIRWGGPKAAASLQLPLSWQIEGSLWNDLKVTNVTTGGGEGHWLPQASIGELSLDYDWRLFKDGDLENAISRVKLHDVDAVADLRHLPPPKATATPKPEKPPGQKPPIIWPKTVDVRNVNADVTLADGGRLVVRGLTLQMGEGMPGLFECQELRREPGDLYFKDLRAEVLWEPRQLTIRNLALPNEVILERLALNVEGIWEADSSATVVLLARLGEATLATQASVKGLFTETMQVKADIQGRSLRAAEMQTLGLPNNVAFENGSMDVRVEGDPARPVALQVEAKLSVDNLRTAGASIDAVSITATVNDGRAVVEAVEITRARNRLLLTAEAVLPTDVKDIAMTLWTAKVQGELPEPVAFLDEPPPVKGGLTLNVTAQGQGGSPGKVEGSLIGTALAFENYKLPKLEAWFALEGEVASVKLPGVELGQGNALVLDAELRLDGQMPGKASWQLRITDPARLFETTGLEAPPEPVAGVVELQGKAEFQVKELTDKKYDGVLADLTLRINQAVYGQGQAEEVIIAAKVEDGRAEVHRTEIRLDTENALDLTGRMDLIPPHAFAAQGRLNLAVVTGLNGWLTTFKSPAMESGSIIGTWQVEGKAQPFQPIGKADLAVTNLRTQTMPEAANATLQATFEGTQAELGRLEARLGPWRLAVKGSVDDKEARLTELKVWQNQTELLSGTVQAPLDLMKTQADGASTVPMEVNLKAANLKVHEILAAAGVKDIPQSVLNADIQLKGRPDTAEGKIFVEVKDIVVPNAPKSFRPAVFRSETILENKRVRTQTTVVQPPLQTLTVEGDVPLDLTAILKAPPSLRDTPLRFSIRLPESDLGFLREYAPDMIRSLPGKVKVDATIEGTVAKPVISGDVNLNVPEVVWSKPDLPSVRDVRVRIEAQDRTVKIQTVTAVLAGGRVGLTGDVNIEDLANPALNLSLSAREALVFRDPTSSARANADIRVNGTLKQSAVNGRVEIVRGRVFKEIDLMPVLKLPADVPPVPENTGRSEARLELPALVKDWTFNVQVRTSDPVLIAGNLANGAVSADVSLTGNGAAPQLNGTANVDRLLLKLPFSMVKVTKGVVTLRPDHPFDPDLDIRGESRMSSYDITLYVYGNSTNPRTRFTSSPPLSETDIVTMLATGTTLGGSASELASEAATRAAFLFLSEFYRKTFNKKKVIREDPPKLSLTFNPSGADRSNDSVQAAYELTDNWRITGRFTQTGRMRAGLGYVLKFGHAAVAMDERPQTPLAKPMAVSPMPLPAPDATPAQPPPAATP